MSSNSVKILKKYLSNTYLLEKFHFPSNKLHFVQFLSGANQNEFFSIFDDLFFDVRMKFHSFNETMLFENFKRFLIPRIFFYQAIFIAALGEDKYYSWYHNRLLSLAGKYFYFKEQENPFVIRLMLINECSILKLIHVMRTLDQVSYTNAQSGCSRKERLLIDIYWEVLKAAIKHLQYWGCS